MTRAITLTAIGVLALGAAQAAPPINLPADEAAHPQARTEWMYLCGHLDAGGDRYGFVAAFFMVRPREAGTAAPASFAVVGLTDEKRRSHLHTVIPMAGSRAWSAQRMALRYPHNWLERMGDDPPQYRAHLEIPGPLAAKPAPRMALDLTLTSRSPPLFINDGIIKFPSGRMTYYYSWPRLAASGTLRLPVRGEIPVTGTAWLEHQWGSFEAFEDFGQYDYFALQLDDGTNIILLDLAGPDGGRRLGRVMWPDGRQQAVGFEREALGRWTSPRTAITYPLGWSITIPQTDSALRLTPTLQDQEISKMVTQRFWEGSCRVSGTVAGRAVAGRAFVELVGYDRKR